MSQYIEGGPRTQTILLPKTLEEAVEKDNPVRFIDAWINSLNMEKIGFTHTTPQETGRPPYNPKDLAKLYLYGGLNHVRSSRKLERECHTNTEAMWLMKGLTPDFKTIADFRKDNPQAIKALFKEFVSFCKRLNLYGAQLIAVDGTKLKAQNALDKDFNQKTLAKRIKLLEKSVTRYIEELDAADEEEEADEQQAARDVEKNQADQFWVDKVGALLEKKDKCEELLKQMKDSGQNEVAFTDPECRLMKNRGRVEPCYNVQTAVDAENHLIVDYAVTNEATDINELASLAVAAKETLGVEHLDVTADKGYDDFLQIKECVDNGVTPYVAQQKHPGPNRGGVPSPEFTADKFTYDNEADVYVCPAGQRLSFWHSNVRGEMDLRVYKCKNGICSSCRFFMVKCTTNKLGRLILRWVHEEIIDEMKERLRLHPEVMDKRKELAEHPFGTIKRAFGWSYLLLKGLLKVGGEVGFTMIAYNMRRALNILGPAALIGALG
jgi:transposase